MDYADVFILIAGVFEVVFCRECYNYKEDPNVRECEHGCCGNTYEEYCCNVTLQIIGCSIGGVVVVCVILAVAYYCYRKKSKGRQHGGLFGRFGLRSNLTGVQPSHGENRARSHGHHVPPTHMNSSQRPPYSYSNPAYMQHYPAYPNPPVPASAELYPSAPMQTPSAPTAPMPPPYSIEPPPYATTKETVPPPAYSTVVSHMRPGYKYDEYYGNMPPPST